MHIARLPPTPTHLQQCSLAGPAAPDDKAEAVGRQVHVEPLEQRLLRTRRMELQALHHKAGTCAGFGSMGMLAIARNCAQGTSSTLWTCMYGF